MTAKLGPCALCGEPLPRGCARVEYRRPRQWRFVFHAKCAGEIARSGPPPGIDNLEAWALARHAAGRV